MAGPPRIGDDTRGAIIQAVRSGERRSRVARRFGVSGTTVTAIARRAGVIDTPLSEARKAAIRAITALSQELAKLIPARQAGALMNDACFLLGQPVDQEQDRGLGGGGASVVAVEPGKFQRPLQTGAHRDGDRLLGLGVRLRDLVFDVPVHAVGVAGRRRRPAPVAIAACADGRAS